MIDHASGEDGGSGHRSRALDDETLLER